MASLSSTLVASPLISLFVFHLILAADPTVTGYGVSDENIDCGAECEARCKLSSRPKLCQRACGTCCMRCQCVPPGTSGGEDVRPCYASMTTHGGKHKCP